MACNCSSISAVLSTVIGLHFGHVLVHLQVNPLNQNNRYFITIDHCLIGVYFFLPTFQDHSSRLKHWLLMGLALLISGLILHFTHGVNCQLCNVTLLFWYNPLPSFLSTAAIPLNKQLYTLSYVCVTSGAAALVFSAFYFLVCFFFH